MDLSEIMPSLTSRGDEIISNIDDESITVSYLRKRGKPTAFKINRYVDRETFIAGVMIWACEGTRRRLHELEMSNSSQEIAMVYMSLLRQLGIEKYARFRVQALENNVKSCEKFWENCLDIHKIGKPIIHIKKVRENSKGIVNIRINSTILKELFAHWAHILPDLLQ